MKFWDTCAKALREERGAYLVLIAAILPLIFGFVGLAVDVGNYQAHSAKLQHASDAAALAGASMYAANDETESSHPLADETAEKYLKANLGSGEFASLVNTGNEIRYQVQTDDQNISYYRVYIKENLDTTFIRLLGSPFFTYPQGEAIATIPATKATDQISFDSLFSFDGQMDGTFNNNNGNDEGNEQNRIQSTYDGNIYCFNPGNYQKYQNDWYYNKIYTGAARDLTRQEANDKGLYTSIQGGSPSDFNAFAKKADSALKTIFDNDPTVVKVYNNQNPTLPGSYPASDYYHVRTDSSGNLNLKLSNFPGDQNKPVYIYIDEKIRGSFNVNLESNIKRPIIFCYTEKSEIHFNNPGYDFRGVVYAPYSNFNPFVFEKGTFTGTIIAHDLTLNSNNGKFVFEQFGIPVAGTGGSGSSSGSSGTSVDLKLVPDPGLGWDS